MPCGELLRRSRLFTAVEQRNCDGFAVMVNRGGAEARRKLPPRLRALRGEILRRSRHCTAGEQRDSDGFAVMFTAETQRRGGNYLRVSATSVVRYCGVAAHLLR